jgi:hypothetical protein
VSSYRLDDDVVIEGEHPQRRVLLRQRADPIVSTQIGSKEILIIDLLIV